MNHQTAPSPELSDLKYVILPGKLAPNSPLLDLHNSAYAYWKGFWNQVFTANGLDHPVPFECDFARMDLITLLLHEGKIAGMHLYAFFNLGLQSQREHEYFRHNQGSVFLEALDHKRVDVAMSMEYLTVDPAWRKSITGVSLASILVSLGTRVQRACGSGASLGRAREDVGVDRMLTDVGGDVLRNGLPMHNTPVSLISIFTESAHDLPDTKSKSLTEQYWNNRTDYSEQTKTAQPRKIAA